mmetsp:Transcript_60807/g.133198  ORF Transcript_60807/g.133198 Transcript_60807/m.133198 type:complete len:291 (+) Transcript_60807:970-1842(+)
MVTALWWAGVIILHIFILVTLDIAALIVFILLILIEVLLFPALLSLGALHLLLVDLQQSAEERRILSHQICELSLQVLLLSVPLLNLRLLLTELILTFLDLVHDAGLILTTLGCFLQQRLILLFQFVQGQQLLIEYQQFHLCIFEVALQFGLFLLNGCHGHVEGVYHLSHVLLELPLIVPKPRLGLYIHSLRQLIAPGLLLKQFAAQGEASHTASCKRCPPTEGHRWLRRSLAPLQRTLAACLLVLFISSFLFTFLQFHLPVNFIVAFLFILLIKLIFSGRGFLWITSKL